MPDPIAVCLESLEPSDDERRFLRCVALVGRQPGLRITDAGEVRWQEQALPAACELWVSADDRLILFRPDPAGARVRLHRGGRDLDLPPCKPVVLIDQDELEVGARLLRVHLHGTAASVHEPAVFVPTAVEDRGGGPGRLVRAAATALALGAAVGAAGSCKQVEVRDAPPTVAPVPPKPDATRAPDQKVKPPPVEVRDRPPEVMPEPREKADPKPKK